MVDVGIGLIDQQSRSTVSAEAAMATLEDARALFEQRGVRGLTRVVDAYGEDIAGVLCRIAGECEADLVVMGTHGRHGIGRLLVGSVAEAVLRRTEVPVLLVRRERDLDENPFRISATSAPARSSTAAPCGLRRPSPVLASGHGRRLPSRGGPHRARLLPITGCRQPTRPDRLRRP